VSFFVGLTENKDKNKADILLLSIAANVVSRHTSMVGVDRDRKEKIVGEMIQRDVPLMMSRTSAYMSACAMQLCAVPAVPMVNSFVSDFADLVVYAQCSFAAKNVQYIAV